MAPKQRNLNPTGLGRAIINRKSKDARESRESNMYSTDVDTTTRLQSITQERDLDEFLNTAQLAGTEFTAEKRNVTIIQAPSTGPSSAHNPFLLTEQEEEVALKRHKDNKARLRVPRRPAWTRDMAHMELERQERDAFLEWRRGLAQLQDEENLLLTPFERNLEVWRQLWRVLERSHLVVQIVDARNPLRFRCEDLEHYVKDVEGAEGERGTGPGKRNSLLLINKADLLTVAQRRQWADYFDAQKIQYAFFSAANAVAIQQARRDALVAIQSLSELENRGSDTSEGEDEDEGEESAGSDHGEQSFSQSDHDYSEVPQNIYYLADEEIDNDQRTKVLSVLELEELFLKSAPDLSNYTDANGTPPTKLVVGLVGYPNVGKSSTINSLLGEKKVSVSSTPGKTKHFQTIPLSASIMLCDCPGLVFPQFATTKADLVCDGVLPIDQMKEYTGPCTLVVKRIPQPVLEGIYGLAIRVKSVEEGGDGKITAEDFLIAYAIARGFTRSGQGNPDEARAARYILKDYVNAKLLFCHPPPGLSEDDFNAATRDRAIRNTTGKKRAPTTRVGKGADTFVASEAGQGDRPAQSNKSRVVDNSFFASGTGLSSRPFIQGGARNGLEFTRGKTMPHQNALADDGTPLDGRRARIAAVRSSAGIEGKEGKKHFKGNKRIKQRSGKGYD